MRFLYDDHVQVGTPPERRGALVANRMVRWMRPVLIPADIPAGGRWHRWRQVLYDPVAKAAVVGVPVVRMRVCRDMFPPAQPINTQYVAHSMEVNPDFDAALAGLVRKLAITVAFLLCNDFIRKRESHYHTPSGWCMLPRPRVVTEGPLVGAICGTAAYGGKCQAVLVLQHDTRPAGKTTLCLWVTETGPVQYQRGGRHIHARADCGPAVNREDDYGERILDVLWHLADHSPAMGDGTVIPLENVGPVDDVRARAANEADGCSRCGRYVAKHVLECGHRLCTQCLMNADFCQVTYPYTCLNENPVDIRQRAKRRKT